MTFEYIPLQRLPISKKARVIFIVWTAKINKVLEHLEEKIELPILIFRENEYQVNSYVMGVSRIPKNLDTQTFVSWNRTEIADKFAVVMEKNETTTVGRLLNGKKRRFSKTIFYSCKSKATVVELSFSFWSWKLDMKVPCTLHFDGQSDFIDILSNELCKHNWWYSYHT